jgi:hypothetical protein
VSVCRIEDAAAALAGINPGLSAWLAAAARRLRAGLPAAAALELAGVGAVRERDKWLLMAARIMRQQDETMWHLAGRIAARLARPPRADAIGELLTKAGAASRLPGTQRRIYGILLEARESLATEIQAGEMSGR